MPKITHFRLGYVFLPSGLNIVSLNVVFYKWLCLSEYGSNHYQVTNQLQVHCAVPWLSHVIVLLQQTQEIAQDFLNKVTVTHLPLFTLSTG